MRARLLICAAALALATAATAPALATDQGPAAVPAVAKTKKKPKPAAGKRRRPAAARPPAPGSADDPHRIADAPKITAFPQDEAAVSKAFAEHRRDQIADAERTARAPKQDDRWRNVLFHVRDLSSPNDSEACFWRTVAYYRLGELARARRTRQVCQLPPPDAKVLDEEDVASVGLQPPAALPELKLAADLEADRSAARTTTPVANTAAYTGPAPAPAR
jgi:hypothetical protein